MPRPRSWEVEILWCSHRRRRTGNGWAFPPNVRKKLLELTEGMTVLQLFGGQSTFGVRLDIDTRLRPDVIGDAWLPPFRRDAFDVVIIDPPYLGINQQMKQQLLIGASWCARRWVIWFHTLWIAGNAPLTPHKAWLVRVGDTCAVRCLQVFNVSPAKRLQDPYFTRGPAIKYNRWLGTQGRFALDGKSETAAAAR
jgi:hypothetical protein